jgi:diguanylate cyclase (GGDEF)-like protein/PAS domain S-box-containing protein
MKDSIDNAQLLETLFDGVMQVDVKGRITLWNKAAERITGFPAEKLIGKNIQKQPAKHLSENGRELPDGLIPLLSTINDGMPRESIAHLKHVEGYQVPVITRTLANYDDKGKITGGIEIFNDNRALIAAFKDSQKTEETVLFDPLTHIGNRPHIETKLRFAINDYHIKNTRFGILFIDIDFFKKFNDTYGHLLGDKVLRMVANSLRNNLRVSDSCGRWGGEEFIVLVNELDMAGLGKVAEKLRTTIAQTEVKDNDLDLSVTVSIGATLIRPDDTIHALIDRADRLMYKSKRAGRNKVTIGD